MGRQVAMPLHDRNRSRPPAFIGRVVFACTTQCKGRDDTSVKCGAVIIVDEKDHVGLFFLHPFLGKLKTLENRTVVVVVFDAFVTSDAQSRNVATRHTGRNICHD